MKKLILFIAILMTSMVYAQQLMQPTPASKPIPSLQKTQNPDTVLREKVQNKLTKVPLLKNQAVTAGSENGVIVLEGTVENKVQENAAINAAKSISGVKKVRSQLTIKFVSNENKK